MIFEISSITSLLTRIEPSSACSASKFEEYVVYSQFFVLIEFLSLNYINLMTMPIKGKVTHFFCCAEKLPLWRSYFDLILSIFIVILAFTYCLRMEIYIYLKNTNFI